MRNLIFACLGALTVLLSTGCGLLFQTAVGWHSQEQVTKSENKLIEVTSAPQGAQVIRRGPDGAETTIGTAPLTDSIPVQIETTVEHPSVWALVVGALVEGAAAVALIATAPGGSDSGSTGSDLGSANSAASKALAVGAGASILIFLTIPELIVALVHGLSGESVVQRKTVGGSKAYLYAGRLGGYPDGLALVRVPEQGRAQLVLDNGAVARISPGAASSSGASGDTAKGTSASGSSAAGVGSAGVGSASGTGARPGATWVIAVMDVEDLNAQTRDKAIDPGLVKNLGDQLRIFVAQRGVRTVERGAQEKAIKEQISSMKSESYKQCYDDSCQVELGKALAASHILRSRITRFGRRCVLNAELIDLKSEVTMAASSSQGDCEAEGFLTMSESVATNLLAK
jgi:TolB-like protein